MEEEVAAQSQYRLGEKHTAWTSSPAGRVYRAVEEVRSHRRMEPSLPAEAHRDPSGEMVMVETYPVWPRWSALRVQVSRSQT